jgi:hypothetical protein
MMINNKEEKMNYENMSHDELVAALQKAEAASKKNVVVKVSPKGAVQLNGIRRFPVTFYKDEWSTIFSMKDQIESFIVDHEGELATKAA